MSSAMVRWQLLVIILYNLPNVDSLTNIDIEAIIFQNAAGRRQDGECCDVCITKCDTRLTFCLDEVGNSEKTRERCSLKKKISEEYRDQNTVHFSNEIISAQLENWEGSIAFEVIIIDEDLYDNDVIDEMYAKLLVPIPDETNKKIWHPKTIHGQRASNRTSLEIQFAIYCVAGWYGDKCELLHRSTTEEIIGRGSTIFGMPLSKNIQIGIILGGLSLAVIFVTLVTILCYRKHAETRSASTEPASRQAGAVTIQHPIGQLDSPKQVEIIYEEIPEDIIGQSVGGSTDGNYIKPVPDRRERDVNAPPNSYVPESSQTSGIIGGQDQLDLIQSNTYNGDGSLVYGNLGENTQVKYLELNIV
ncbi:hypothetical protein LSH36_443g04034 [Paralvinella palmiformis]|uniref:Notch ligand N-terminal domain-containing protein n=1 Tax=Paralvinella palmiformis TaxID=53620 RepID=A0AAD9JAT0_9ANNE|nr:hypothetical protein LSH36_443g04034 [Paralvinella palmiformis]